MRGDVVFIYGSLVCDWRKAYGLYFARSAFFTTRHFGTGCVLALIQRNKAVPVIWPVVSIQLPKPGSVSDTTITRRPSFSFLPLTTNRNRSVFLFFLANYQHERHFLNFGLSNFLPNRLVAVVN